MRDVVLRLGFSAPDPVYESEFIPLSNAIRTDLQSWFPARSLEPAIIAASQLPSAVRLLPDGVAIGSGSLGSAAIHAALVPLDKDVMLSAIEEVQCQQCYDDTMVCCRIPPISSGTFGISLWI